MLNGRTVLIVEEEFLIALDLQRMLEGLGVGQTLFARNAAEAEQLRAQWPDIALALVEIRYEDAPAESLVSRLADARIPVVLTTSDDGVRRGLPQFFHLPLVVKPVPESALASATHKALATFL